MNLEEKAKQYAQETGYPIDREDIEETYIAGAKENGIHWHDLRKDPNDLPKGENIHRKVLLQDRYGNVYTGNYYPKDKCHSENCFSVEYLEYGFQGCNFVAFEQIAKWAEFME